MSGFPRPRSTTGSPVLRLTRRRRARAARRSTAAAGCRAVRGAGACADLRRRGRKSHLAARSRPAHDFEVDDEALVLRSAELAEAGDWGAEALAVNRALVDRHPDAAGARYRLAVCLEEAGDLLAARAAYERVPRRAAPKAREARVGATARGDPPGTRPCRRAQLRHAGARARPQAPARGRSRRRTGLVRARRGDGGEAEELA